MRLEHNLNELIPLFEPLFDGKHGGLNFNRYTFILKYYHKTKMCDGKILY